MTIAALETASTLSDPAAGVGIPIAFAAGAVSFASPCVLPLVPGYLAAVTGVNPERLESASWRQVLVPSLFFIATFSAIFIALGVSATGLGSALRDNRELLSKISGSLIIGMGVFLIAALFITKLNREFRVEALMSRAGRGGPIVTGAAFGIAFTPCVGPTLGAILSAAALSGSAGRGAFLLAVYSAGLAIPFLATALGFSRMTSAFGFVRRHFRAIMVGAGLVLVGMGVLVFTDELFRLNIEAQRLLDRFGLNIFQAV